MTKREFLEHAATASKSLAGVAREFSFLGLGTQLVLATLTYKGGDNRGEHAVSDAHSAIVLRFDHSGQIESAVELIDDACTALLHDSHRFAR